MIHTAFNGKFKITIASDFKLWHFRMVPASIVSQVRNV